MELRIWQHEEARNRFDEVVDQTLSHGPQLIVWQGLGTVVVVPYEEYQQHQLGQKKLSEFFRDSPLADAELDFSREETRSNSWH